MSIPYQYQRLLPDKSIRVLHVQPSLDLYGPIKCTFSETSLAVPDDQIFPYEALSYVWGSPFGDREILCEGKTLLITENCLSALRRLRQKDRVRILWIDAICINQKCIKERNQQVRIMGEIYKKATRVLIWLGEEEDRFAPTLRRLKWIALVLKVLEVRGITMKYLTMRFSVGQNEAITNWMKFRDYCAWNERAWTLQEHILARRVTFHVGSGSIPDTLDKTCLQHLLTKKMMHSALPQPNIPSSFPHTSFEIPAEWVSQYRNLDKIAWQVRDYLYLHLIHMARSRLASEPRDKVYSMYAILTNAGFKLPEPDYNLPVEVVYEQFISAFMEHSSSLRILEIVAGPRNISDLSSWMPDLSARFRADAGILDPLDLDSFRCHYKPLPQRGALRVFGRRFDMVVSATEPIPGPLYDFRAQPSTTEPKPSYYYRCLAILLLKHLKAAAVGGATMSDAIEGLMGPILCSVHRRYGQGELVEVVQSAILCAVCICGDVVKKLENQNNPLTFDENEFGTNFATMVGESRSWGAISMLCLLIRGFRLVIMPRSKTLAVTAGSALPADIVVALDGLSLPVILRLTKGGFSFVGVAYCKISELYHPKAVDEEGSEFFTLI